MRKTFVLISVIIFSSSVSNAQLWKLRRYEVAAGIGTTQFFGDIGGFSKDKNLLGLKDFILHQTRFNLSSGMRYRILENVSVRFNFTMGYFHSTDVKGSNEIRGFESSTLFIEPAIIGEYYIIKNRGENSLLLMKGKENAPRSFFSMLDLYVFAGIGGLSYKVQPNELLKPTVTKNNGFTGIIPAGLGVNMLYTSNISLGIELGGRYSFSDLIDGYTSSASKSNDVYYFLNFVFTYKLKTGKKGLSSF
jgi:hypothetical protein